MTREEKQKAIDALKISAPVRVMTQEEFNDYIQTLNKIMDWLEQEPTTKNDLGVDCIDRNSIKYYSGHGGYMYASKGEIDKLPLVTPRPRNGHWIDKQRLFESCSAECSSCHKRSNGYLHDNGFSLVSKYFDFCPKCGSDNREVEE